MVSPVDGADVWLSHSKLARPRDRGRQLGLSPGGLGPVIPKHQLPVTVSDYLASDNCIRARGSKPFRSAHGTTYDSH